MLLKLNSRILQRYIETFAIENRIFSTNGEFKDSRLFRSAQMLKSDDKNEVRLTAERAMLDYALTREQLEGLPTKPLQKSGKEPVASYLLEDVYKTAMRIHGSKEAMRRKRQTIIEIGKKLKENQHLRRQLVVESRSQILMGASRVVGIAFTLNCCDALSKYVAAYLTGSKSMFAEAVHSTMDTFNQLILLTGIRYSTRNADQMHPYGYGNMRYISSLISGCGILSFGCGLSIYHGISGLMHPTTLEPLTYAYLALIMSFLFQGSSALTAFREVRLQANLSKLPIIDYIKHSSDPTLNVVLLEDSAAVCGVAIAMISVSLSSILESSVPDSIGSILIGCVLGLVASVIIRANIPYLVGKSLPILTTDAIISCLSSDPSIRSVHDVKATTIGFANSRFKAEIEYNGRAITNKYINERLNLKEVLKKMDGINTEEQLREFLLDHGEQIIDLLADEVDRIEANVVTKYPEVRHVDLESF